MGKKDITVIKKHNIENRELWTTILPNTAGKEGKKGKCIYPPEEEG